MIDHFTHRARRVLVLARQEAERMKRNFIDTEHILLALLSEGTSFAADALRDANVNLERAREVAGELFGPAPDFVSYGQLPYAPDVRAVFNRAEEEAHQRKHVFVDTAHLLVGLLRVEESQALKVLQQMAVDLKKVEDEVTEHLATVEPPSLRPSMTGLVAAEAAAVTFGQAMDRFTDRARRVLELSRREAEILKHDRIGTEHLLLGLLAESSGVAAAVLFSMGADVGKVRSALFKLATPSRRYIPGQQFPLTIQTKDALRFALEEAKALKHDFVGTEHLLLGLLRVTGGPAIHIMESMSLEAGAVRKEVLKLITTKDSFRGGKDDQDDESEDVWPRTGFTDPTRRALDYALEEARGANAARIATEHLLVGLLAEGSNMAVRALQAFEIDLPKARSAVAKLGEPAGTTVRPERLAPDTQSRKALQIAQIEATDAGRNHVGTEHLLLGLIGDKGMRSLQVLEQLGARAVEVRAKLRELRPPELAEFGATGLTDTTFLLMAPSTFEETVWSDYEWAQEHTSEQASRALFLAGQEADRMQCPETGTEHLLLGLLGEGKGMAADVLGSLGLQLAAVRAAVKERVSPAAEGTMDTSSDRPFSDDFKKAIDLAKDEARDRRHNYLGSEHLLLGLLGTGGKVGEVLAALKIDPAQIREAVLKVMADRR